MQKQFLAALGVAALVCFAGCDSGIPTYPVSGTVTDASGNPIEGATVSFVADGEGTATALGKTDASGNYTLRTKAKAGAQEGSYKVTIAKYAESEGDVTTERPDLEDTLDITDEYPDDFNEEQESAKAAKEDGGSELPKKYESPESSGLTATVSSSGDNNFDFKIEE